MIGNDWILDKLRLLKFDKVIFIPSYLPPHKHFNEWADAWKRARMVKLAIAKYKRFFISYYEIRKNRKSYSIDTVRYFRRRFGRNTELFFLIGADSACYLKYWRKIEELTNLVNFVVVPRPGYTAKCRYRILRLNIKPMALSSTEIRNAIRNKRPVTGLIPQSVYTFIKKNGLYRGR